MDYVTLGSTGLAVSRLGFGALTFSEENKSLESVYKVGEKLADELVGQAIDAGVNFFDTADVYADGESEKLLGRALKPHRENIVLTTKLGNRGGTDMVPIHAGLSKRHIHWSIDQSLGRLGTDWIDFYVVHCEDVYTPLEETLEALDDVVRAGKVRYLGFSNWSAWKAAAAIEYQRANGLAEFTHGQMYYSLLGRDVERDILPMIDHFGIGMSVWSPLAFGFLAGAYSREDMEKPDNRFSNFDMLGFDRDRAFALLDVMRPIAKRRGISMAQLAIAWVLARGGVDSVLIGATKAHQLEDNLGAVDVALSEEDIAALDEATAIEPLYATSGWVRRDPVLAKLLD